ncbi:hypothetical protein EJ04DRAFT_566732 [Polyplosphaeria fusca]|uniref:Uncharacterized protein n=1 Tax=Polyplosphaeria fusca TaxID=682080 RepID=A0A9P4QUG2_9PLEO|nr:hypothetical protein EJ04DRAFT_566732 [Polyplosphaeria fusca]
MASTPRRVPTTPPSPSQPVAAPKSRIRKPSAKVLEAQQSLRTRTATRRSAQDDEHTTAVRAAQPSAQPAEQAGSQPYRDDSTAEPQSSVIESIRNDLADIRIEQQRFQTQYADLQEVVSSLRTQLDILSTTPSIARPPQAQAWASVASSRGVEGPNTTPPRTTSSGNANKECRQLVIDVSRVDEQTAERVATTEAAKQIIQQGIGNVERLAGAIIKDFRVWRAHDNANVIKFSVERDKEAAFRQTTTEWLEP